ncbi:hypothetical protein pEaSNUABM50_00496 [Erwinia phage pEa_SNUABM_50]|uniref:Uncharacterized protein n=2 Tax=Eneladusvirus BF TaxID=2560751 RepID=A0A7L8ZQG5_9CAUD|nr:hypothetical protein pEaSNUABM12_00560 [Erwinia phage pEa_SNUABM_12]QOI72492.1 hypothetical protein pEaSNUABM50_00496 [Erwinia phage pEa_SNUABM_50]QXO11620.1 hypothetical protein pEaSNUABM19_00503 [Erwinia phage pEa_SNUABM_19]
MNILIICTTIMFISALIALMVNRSNEINKLEKIEGYKLTRV